MQPNISGAEAPEGSQREGTVGRHEAAPGLVASGRQGSRSAVPLWDGGVSVGTHVLTRLSVSCLSYLSGHPGVSGTEVCRGLEVRHLSQVSRLLGRLEAKGLVENEARGHENAWRLTEHGREVLSEAQPVWAEPAGHQGSPSVVSTLPSITA